MKCMQDTAMGGMTDAKISHANNGLYLLFP